MEMSGLFWMFSEHPLVRAAAVRIPTESYPDQGPCDMLIVAENGRATCLIQRWLGWKGKPKACRDYPFDGEQCFFTTKDAKNTK